MIYQGSRYENAPVATIYTDRGWHPTVLRGLPTVTGTGEFLLSENDTLQSLAFRAYGDAELWWHIADANPHLLYPDRIPAGTVIKVPYVDTLR